MFIGALFAVVSLPASLSPDEWALGERTVNYAAVLGYVLGLAVFWFSGLIVQPSRSPGAALRRNRLRRDVFRRNGG